MAVFSRTQLGVVVSLALGSDAQSAQSATVPTAVDHVPTAIPTDGVSIDPVANIVLTPAEEKQASRAVSAEDAIANTPAFKATGKPVEARAVLAYTTIGATIPTGSAANEKADTVESRLVWVVTLTYPEPVDPTAGGAPTDTPEPLPSSDLKSHFKALIGAQTGQLVWGFFTK